MSSPQSPATPTNLSNGKGLQPATVQVHALTAGHFSIPAVQFITPTSEDARMTVPSLSFLIQHRCVDTGRAIRIVFDLGLRRDINRYSEPIRNHVRTREPLNTDPDVAKSLGRGGLVPDDIDYVILSHVHWDHVGEPRDFLHSTFVVGHGSLALLHGKPDSLRGGHSFFEADLLDPSRTIELPDPMKSHEKQAESQIHRLPPTPPSSTSPPDFDGPWERLDKFDLPSVLDVFRDGSLYIVNAPGHLPGHINILARISDTVDGTIPPEGSGPSAERWVYLAGDACHDRRIIRREKAIGEWFDVHGFRCCIHSDRAKAEETLEMIRGLEARGVEVIFAHDVEWEMDARNQQRFFGASL